MFTSQSRLRASPAPASACRVSSRPASTSLAPPSCLALPGSQSATFSMRRRSRRRFPPQRTRPPSTSNLFATLLHTQAAAGVGAGCGLAFFAGLRGGRVALSGLLPAVEPPSLDNLKADAALSLSIGGATGTFVGVVPDFSDNPFLGPSHLQRPSLSESARRASCRIASRKLSCRRSKPPSRPPTSAARRLVPITSSTHLQQPAAFTHHKVLQLCLV